jgi:putative phosphoribosyl transferase
VVDDFVATGAVARAAARAARRRGATRVLLAIPAISAAIEPELRGEYDQVVALEAVTAPETPSTAYVRLEEVTDAAAVEYLRDARLERLGEEAAPAVAP